MIMQQTKYGMISVGVDSTILAGSFICYDMNGCGPTTPMKCDCPADVEMLALDFHTFGRTLLGVWLDQIQWSKYCASMAAPTPPINVVTPAVSGPGAQRTLCVMPDGNPVWVEEASGVAPGTVMVYRWTTTTPTKFVRPIHSRADVVTLYNQIQVAYSETIRLLHVDSSDYAIFLASELATQIQTSMHQLLLAPVGSYPDGVVTPNLQEPLKCECGAAKIGCPTHSSWCACYGR